MLLFSISRSKGKDFKTLNALALFDHFCPELKPKSVHRGSSNLLFRYRTSCIT